MLDENLPTFYFNQPSSAKQPQHDHAVYYSQYGSELEPAYTFRHPDPAKSDSKNRYAVALYDSFNPDVLFAEVLLIPEWTQPTLTAEATRLNGGVAPPPEPVLPIEFVIQLYNPDQQVTVKQVRGSWNKTPTWEFELPQQTFRAPSASTLDRTQHDPVALDSTPKIGFRWKKDGKFGKDLACYHSGKVLDVNKKKNKEPDITVAIFKALREVTLYEPNLQRIEIEDLKGFEVVLLLGAVVIRDVYFGQLRETFNISDTAGKPGTGSQSAAVVGLYSGSSQPPPKATGPQRHPQQASRPPRDPRVPPTDPRSQWEIDAETARLRQQAEAQERERRHREQAEERRIKKMLEAEEKEKRRQQAEIDKETERLKRIYGKDDARARPTLPPRHPVQNGALGPSPFDRPQSHPQHYLQQPRPGTSPYLAAPNGSYNASTNNLPATNPYAAARLKNKSSIFSFNKRTEDPSRLSKKKSSMF